MYHIFLIHSPVNGYQSCFNVLAFVNSAAMYLMIYVHFSITVFSGYMPSNGADGSFAAVQLLSCVSLWPPWTAAHQASLSISTSWSLLKPMSTDSRMSSNHLVLCCTLLILPFPVLGSFPMCWPIKWPKYWNFSFSISPSSEYSELIPLGLTSLISLLSKGFSRVFFSTTVQEHQFFGTQPSLWLNAHIHTWLVEKPRFWLYRPLSAKWCFCFLICCLGLS